MLRVHASVAGFVLTVALMLAPTGADVRAQSTDAKDGKAADSPASWVARTRTAVEAANLENAFYYYRSLVHVQGAEDRDLLADVAELSLRSAMRRERRWVRLASAEALARHGDLEALEVLRDTAIDMEAHATLRMKAVELLGELRDRESIPTLQEAVYDEERPAQERLSAADALMEMEDSTGALFLVRILENGKPAEKIRAANIAGDRRLSVSSALRQAAEQQGPLHLRALRALALLGEAGAIETLRVEFGSPASVLPTVEIQPPVGAEDATPFEALDHVEVNRLYGVGVVLLETGDTKPVDYFAVLARDARSPSGRAAPALQVVAVDRDRGMELLRELMQTSPVPLLDRVRAAEELARQGEPEGVVEVFAKSYRSTLEGGNDSLRMQVLLALERVRIDGVEAILVEALDDPSPIHRIVAARGLVERGDPSGLRPLRRLLDGADRAAAVKAAEALLASPPPPGGPPAPAAPPADREAAPGTS